MGKVKDRYFNPAAAMTEWVARKIINHEPMSVREKAAKKGITKAVDQRQGVAETTAVRYDNNVCFYLLEDGTRLKITIEEMSPEEEGPRRTRVHA